MPAPLSSHEIRKLRGKKSPVEPFRPYGIWDELEATSDKQLASVRVLLLTGSECRFTCTMCDLWKHTLDYPTPQGAIPTQIQWALEQQPLPDRGNPQWIKLYNSSNFFDPRNVPTADLTEIARLTESFDKVIVENHPRLLPDSIKQFQNACHGNLEIAMGLETIHPESLERLNKSLTLSDFDRACEKLLHWQISLRTFLLLKPPGMSEIEGLQWASKSLEYCFDHGVRHCSVIPVRGGNGAMELLAQSGQFRPPQAQSLEQIAEHGIGLGRGIVTVDLWDWDKLVGHCNLCSAPRKQRLEQMNQRQQYADRFICPSGCTDESAS